ncbi:hypothetical protein J4Q44_G00332610 [Coregonus suidteri]|uniref:Uncharacterized protein n=1 Tax=Coregonus suidteri TaxID=861788 RepID=A0AAN8KXJ5_9TELE
MVFRFKEQVYAKVLSQWDLNLHDISSTESDTVDQDWGEVERQSHIVGVAPIRGKAEVKGISGSGTRPKWRR